MADDDDDNFINYGEPLEDENDEPTKNPTAVENQVVKDAQGRRRFHGAFTGGFSAGYFNSVGSKEGWTPSAFISSRSSRGDGRHQAAEDFMDEEDLGEFGIAPRTVKTSNQFASSQRTKKTAVSDERSAIPGSAPLEDLITITNTSIGTEILHKMGWREGQGVGPKVRKYKKKPRGNLEENKGMPGAPRTEPESIEDAMQDFLFGPSDVEEFLFQMKSDQKGLGYRGISQDTSILGGPFNSFGASQSIKGKQRGISGSAFGIGAFEDRDEDVYSVDDMTMYDTVLGGDDSAENNFGWTAPKRGGPSKGSLEGFTPAVKTKSISNKVFPPPAVPHGFRPLHEFPDAEAPKEEEKYSRFSLSSEQRSALLGEELLPGKPVPEEDPSKAAPPPSGSTDSSSESKRVSRFTVPVKGKGTELVLYQKTEAEKEGVTEWEKQRSELSRTTSLSQPMAAMMASRFVSARYQDEEVITEVIEADKSHHENAADMKMYGKLTRESYEWYPDHILCKRFNVPDPYPGSSFVGVPGLQKEKVSVYNFFANPGDFQQPPPPPAAEAATDSLPVNPPAASKGAVTAKGGEKKKKSRWDLKPAILSIIEERRKNVSSETKTEDTQEEEQNSEEKDTRPPMDLFNAIFNESDSSDSDDSESEKEEVIEREMKSTDEAMVVQSDENPAKQDMEPTALEDRPHPDIKVEEGSDDDQFYGPALPPPQSTPHQLNTGAVGATEAVESNGRQSRNAHRKHKKHHHSHSSRQRSDSKRREKKEKKKKKHSKESHREKSRRKHKKRRRDSDSSHTSSSEG